MAFQQLDAFALAVTQAGMLCTMTTGGYGISLDIARRMKEAGIGTVSVSMDGLETTHDRLRGKKGSWKYAFKTMSHFREVGIPFGCNTQINRLSPPNFLVFTSISAMQVRKHGKSS
jgi:MoaA/NifB/PqqE/SkfB family radical SAM enzyme